LTRERRIKKFATICENTTNSFHFHTDASIWRLVKWITAQFYKKRKEAKKDLITSQLQHLAISKMDHCTILQKKERSEEGSRDPK
jgi:hypothetical protein